MNMTFINNSATESGGGIYVEFPPIRFVVDIFNRLCFLQYSDGSGQDVPPQEWAVSVCACACVCVCVCVFESLSQQLLIEKGGRELVHCTLSQ